MRKLKDSGKSDEGVVAVVQSKRKVGRPRKVKVEEPVVDAGRTDMLDIYDRMAHEYERIVDGLRRTNNTFFRVAVTFLVLLVVRLGANLYCGTGALDSGKWVLAFEVCSMLTVLVSFCLWGSLGYKTYSFTESMTLGKNHDRICYLDAENCAVECRQVYECVHDVIDVQKRMGFWVQFVFGMGFVTLIEFLLSFMLV